MFKGIETQLLTTDYLDRICKYTKPFGIESVTAMQGEYNEHTVFDYREFGFKREDWEYDFVRRRQAAIHKAIDVVHKNDMKMYLWRHELMMHEEHIKMLNPELVDYCYGNKKGSFLGDKKIDVDLGFFDPAKKKLWDFIHWRFDHFFELFPNVDGIVLTCLTETKIPIWDLAKNMSKEQILAKLLKVAIDHCQKRKKDLVIRNWGAYRDPKNPQGRVLLDAMKRIKIPKGVLVMEKSYEPDYRMGFPLNRGIEEVCQERDTIIELELPGEQECMDAMPVASPIEQGEAIRHSLAKGCKGFLLRVDCYLDTTQWLSSKHTLETSNEINLFAPLTWINEPELSTREVWRRWAESRFPKKVCDQVIDIIKPTYDYGAKVFHLKDNEFSNSPFSPFISVNTDLYNRYHYTGLLEDRRWYEALQDPDENDIELLLEDKDIAIRGYQKCLAKLRKLKGKIGKKWYEILERGFVMAVSVAKLYRIYAEIHLRTTRYRRHHEEKEYRQLSKLFRQAKSAIEKSKFPNRDFGNTNAGHVDYVDMAHDGLSRCRESVEELRKKSITQKKRRA